MAHMFSMAQLVNPAGACKRKLAQDIEFRENLDDNQYYLRAIARKKCESGLLVDKMSEADAKKMLEEDFEKIPFLSDAQRDIQMEAEWKKIKRRVRGESRTPIKAEVANIDLGHGVISIVTPDYVFDSPQGGTTGQMSFKGKQVYIEVAKTYNHLDVPTKSANADLGLYAMLKYARLLVDPGEKAHIKACKYALTRGDDSNSSKKPNFNPDYWAPKGNHVSSIEEDYVGGDDNTHIDQLFEPFVIKLSEGFDEAECSEEDCEKCDRYGLCHYELPPKVMNASKDMKKSKKAFTLTPAQMEVINFKSGVAVVNAGAGSGKTETTVRNIAARIEEGVKPERCLMVTFSVSGTEEMRARIRKTLDANGVKTDISKMPIVTFNAFGAGIVKDRYREMGYSEEPQLIDDIERAVIIKDLLNRHRVQSLDYRNFDLDMPNAKGALVMASKVFEIVKVGQYTEADYLDVIKELDTYWRFIASETALKELISLYDEYDAALKVANLMEYADQELMLNKILESEPDYFEKYHFEHIICDEFQDSNDRQIGFLKALTRCRSFKSLMVVGDDSQSIFSFRHTSPEFIINFEKFMSGYKVRRIDLVENHRSTPEIISAANKINEKNQNRVCKNLIATRPSGKRVKVKGFPDADHEEEYVIGKIKEALKGGTAPEDISIIAYTKEELRQMASRLAKEDIPSILLAPELLLKNSRVLAALAFVRCTECTDDTKSLLTYTNARLFGQLKDADTGTIGKEMNNSMRIIMEYLQIQDRDEKKAKLMEILRELDCEDEVYGSFLDRIEVKSIEKIPAYCRDFVKFGGKEQVRRMNRYPGIVLTTAHSSKGLEWPKVFCMISKFDKANCHGFAGRAKERQEEVRRLLFVSMTRARDELTVTSRYVAYGKQGDYTYNQYLINVYDVLGKPFNLAAVDSDIQRARAEKAKKRSDEKIRKQKELAALVKKIK